MSVDFTYTGASSYRTYLAGIYQREKIDITLAKNVREAVGSVTEIYGSDRPALREALRDFQYGRPGSPHEVLTLNLHYACAALDPVAGDMISGFHSLFDEDVPGAARPAADEASDAEHLLAYLAALTARQQFAEALEFINSIFVEYPTVCAEDGRFEWLRAALLAGIPGQPKSAATVDLPEAERAFVKIATRVGREHPAEAAAALVEAGRCAYAAGHFGNAEAHYANALARDPMTGEAHYQIGRLRRHAGNVGAARERLTLAFGVKFVYALRAASDPLFRADASLVRRSVTRAVRRAVAATRATLREGAARLRYLASHSDRDFPAAALPAFAPAREQIEARAREPAPATLRQALLQRNAADATRPPLIRLATDYCDLLRANEEMIALRGVDRRAAVRDAGHVARWLTRAAEVSVVAVLIAVVVGMFDFASAAPAFAWDTPASASALGLALAIANLWLLMHTSFLRRPTRQFFERRVVWLQAWSRERFDRGLPRRIVRNRRDLQRRIRRIERRFGIETAR